jgi:hypothetical protein
MILAFQNALTFENPLRWRLVANRQRRKLEAAANLQKILLQMQQDFQQKLKFSNLSCLQGGALGALNV